MSSPRTRTIEWPDPMLTATAAAGRTGLALLQGILDGTIPQAPISATLDFALIGAEAGMARFRGIPGEYHYNPMGTVHGGFACTLLDSALGAAVMSTLDEQTAYTTAQISVNLTRAITRDTGPVVAEARVIHRGSRLATAEGRLTDGAGNLLAHATATCAIMPRR